jgi:hypothetical protein
MKTRIALALSVALLCFSAVPANAATKPTVVTAAFKNLLSASSDSLDQLEQKYESDIDELDTQLANSIKDANTNYDKDLLAASTLYAPQIDAANARATQAKQTYESNNKVRLTTGFFGPDDDRLVWDLDCLIKTTSTGKLLKRYCAAVDGIPTFGETGYGGEDWQPGDITTIALRNAEDKYVASGIAKGFIVPLNLLQFDSSRIAYKQGLADAAALTLKNGNARTAAQAKKNSAIDAANSLRSSKVSELDQDYESAKSAIEAQQTAAEVALLAAKRASKDPAIFDKAFVVAYKFEYNKKMVDQIADAAWTGDWTFRTIDSILKVNKLAVYGDGIASKYSMASATSFNSAVGNAFTNEPDFRAALKVLTTIYKKTTNTTLKF